MRSSSICVFGDRGKPEYPKKKKTSRSKIKGDQKNTQLPTFGVLAGILTWSSLVGDECSDNCATLVPQGIFWYVALFYEDTTEITDVIRNNASIS